LSFDLDHLRPEDIAWIAGIVEGEGCLFMRVRPQNGSILECRVKVSMTDKDIIERLFALIPGSTMNGPHFDRNSKQTKPYWTWYVGKRFLVLRVIKLLLPWFGTRRSIKAAQIIHAIESTPEGRSPCCVV
jgi:hypothetical protein